jgi:hypothetical protein
MENKKVKGTKKTVSQEKTRTVAKKATASKTRAPRKTVRKASKTAPKNKSKGIVENPERLENALTIDQLMGLSSPNLFGAKTEKEFEGQLKEMTLTDMHRLATKVGLLPVRERPIMIKRLKTEFVKYIKSLRPYKLKNQRYYSEGMTQKDMDKARKILSGM